MEIEEPIEPARGAPTLEFDRYRVLKPLIGILNHPSEDELLWLFGCGGGRGRNETPPSDAILKCLPTDPPARALWCTKLATQFAELLRKYPNLAPIHAMSEEAMTHILLISAHLGCANILGDPIWHAYKTLREADKEIPAQLEGALFQALLYNPVQSGESEELYDRLIMGHPDKLFGGMPEQGLNGYLILDALRTDSGSPSPSHAIVGKALFLLAKNYYEQDETEARGKFLKALLRCAHFWKMEDINGLLEMAGAAGWKGNYWSEWSVDCILLLEPSDFQINSPS